MSEIYSLTSPHLFGIISNIIPDRDKASHILKAVYKRVWELRSDIATRETEPLCYLRGLAHRYAVDYKSKTAPNDTVHVLKDLPKIDLQCLKALDLSDQDKRILKLAYLNAASVEDIAQRESLKVQDVQTRLTVAISKVRGRSS